MRLSVFGLGYVGCVTAACLANKRHQVIGVDADTRKIERLRRGRATVQEPSLQDLVARSVRSGALRATSDFMAAVVDSDVSLICVGTPSSENGCLDVGHVETVCRQIGMGLRGKRTPHLVVLRSTVTPGTTEHVVIPTLEKFAERSVGPGLGVCVNPEFMREGTSVADFHAPPFSIIGASTLADGQRLARLYWFLRAQVVHTTLRVAESVKLVCNSFHALKIGFANEIGNFCKALDIDSHDVMDIVCRDRVLNISAKYLKPGFAFGGSCLPKDLRAVLYEAKHRDVDMPIVSAILPSNRLQISRALDMVVAAGRKRVGIIGLSFKEGTDDLRQSPMVQLVEQLIGKGYELKVYDPIVRLSRIHGSNRRYIKREIPHIASLMTTSLAKLCRDSEVLVFGHRPASRSALSHVGKAHVIVDLVRLDTRPPMSRRYRGLSW